MNLNEWVAESIEVVGKEETIELLHDAYLMSAPDQDILDALAALGDHTFH